MPDGINFMINRASSSIASLRHDRSWMSHAQYRPTTVPHSLIDRGNILVTEISPRNHSGQRVLVLRQARRWSSTQCLALQIWVPRSTDSLPGSRADSGHRSGQKPKSMIPSIPARSGKARHRAIDSVDSIKDLEKKPLRTKYVWLSAWAKHGVGIGSKDVQNSADSAVIDFDRKWTAEIGAISGPSSKRNKLLARHYVQRLAGRNMDNRSIQAAWLGIASQHSLRIWQRTMRWCLEYKPKRALRLLFATMHLPELRPPRYMIEDCLEIITKHVLADVKIPNRWALNTIYTLLVKYISAGRRLEVGQHVPDYVVFWLWQHLGPKRSNVLLQWLIEKNVNLHANTLLHIMARCMRRRDVTQSLDVLRMIVASGMDLQKVQVQKACVRLIRTKFNVKDQYKVQTKVLIEILEMGIRPNIVLLNAILLNAVQARSFDLALQLFYMIGAYGVQPNSTTSAIMLRAATEIPDKASYRHLIDVITATLEPADIDTIGHLLFAISTTYEPALPRMLKLYCLHFDPEPLNRVGIFVRRQDCVSSPIVQPSPQIISQILCVRIRETRDPKGSEHLYDVYHRLVEANDSLYSAVAQTDHVANAFIKAFSRRRDMLPNCTKVMAHMLDNSRSKRLSTDPVVVYPKLAAPSVQTWSILMDAFFTHKQPLAAERVLELMRERKLEPDRVTWDTLIRGFAYTGKIAKAVEARAQMTAAGYVPRKNIIELLDSRQQRDRLVNLLQKSITNAKENDTLQV